MSLSLRRPVRRRHDEAGLAVVMVAALCGLLALVGVIGVGVAGLVVAHRRVAASADLAALAGASAAQRGSDPCAAASAIARANTGRVTECRVLDDSSVQITVAFRPGGLLGGADLSARSRAGP